MTSGDGDGATAATRGRSILRIAGAIGLALIAYGVLAWLGGPVPVPCGPRICAPFFHCVHEFGMGQQSVFDPAPAPDDVYRCEPGLGPRREAPRPSMAPAMPVEMAPAATAPAPCGTTACDPSMHCVHEHGMGQQRLDDPDAAAPADVYRCVPGAGPPVDAPRPVAPAGPSSR